MSSRTRGVRWWPGVAGWEHGGKPDEDAVMATAQARGIGYPGRLWSGTESVPSTSTRCATGTRARSRCRVPRPARPGAWRAHIVGRRHRGGGESRGGLTGLLRARPAGSPGPERLIGQSPGRAVITRMPDGM
jgi:hypothetical protein